MYVHLDVTDREQWAHAVATAVERFGKLNVLVNNAGIANYGSIEEFTPEQWDTVIAINLTGVFNGIHAAVAALKAGGAELDHQRVIHGRTPGIRRASRLQRRQVRRRAASPNQSHSTSAPPTCAPTRCHPGAVATPMTEGLDTRQKHVALRHVGTSMELSHLIVFLASDESSFSTGAEFVADGGETAGLAPGATS